MTRYNIDGYVETLPSLLLGRDVHGCASLIQNDKKVRNLNIIMPLQGMGPQPLNALSNTQEPKMKMFSFLAAKTQLIKSSNQIK